MFKSAKLVLKIFVVIAALIIIYAGLQYILENRPFSSEGKMIVVENISNNSYITSPLEIKGKARGTWFFEANAPIILTNWDGLIIAESYIETNEDWMTEDFVDFTGAIEFRKPFYNEKGILILRKANPSGLPEYDNALEIPILFE